VKVEPVFGYERVQKHEPHAHFSTRVFYGARVIAGMPYLSLEGELIRGKDTEVFASQDMTRIDTDDRLKLGLRSSYAMGSILSAHARGGLEARRNTAEVSVSGVK